MSWGGKREGAGRKPKSEGVREGHFLRAYEDEWALIKKFADEVKHGYKQKCKKFIYGL